jgi:CMP-N,N'-diacetyllegionaminic acid synthase
MFNNFKIIAIIGARSGSQGLVDKNIYPFCGHPMIRYTIDAARNSKYIDRIIVSTDSERYATIAKMLGAEAPFLRPKNLASGDASIGSYIQHCMDWLKDNEKIEYDFIISLPPTSPLRNEKHIDEALEKYFLQISNFRQTIVSVYQAPIKVGWLLEQKHNLFIDFCFDIKKDTPQRQDLRKFYLPNGAIKICHQSNIGGDFYNNETFFYEMNPKESADIDTLEELNEAEIFYKSILK